MPEDGVTQSNPHILPVARHAELRRVFNSADQASEVYIQAGLQLGYHALAVNQAREAKSIYDQLISNAVHDWRVYDLGGRTGGVLEDPEIIISAFESLLRIDPDYIGCHFPLGDCYIDVGQFDEARSLFRDAIRLFLSSPSDLARIADRLLGLEDWNSAWLAITAALALEPNNELFLYRRDFALGGSSLLDLLLKKQDEVSEVPPKRVFIGGCGRSGTWLCEQLFSCFQDCERDAEERHAGRFAYLPHGAKLHVLKRMHNSHKTIQDLPADIGLIFMVRHPFDVLVSQHLGKANFITLDNWRDEFFAFQRIVTRANTIVVKYEELISNPNGFQDNLQSTFGISPDHPLSEFHKVARPSAQVAEAMQTLRPFDTSSIGSHLSSDSNIAFCADLYHQHSDLFREACEDMGYEIDPRITGM